MTVMAIDSGGTWIKLGLVRNGKILAQKVIPSHSDRPLQERLPTIRDVLNHLCSHLGIQPNDCAGIGMSFPSLVDIDCGKVVFDAGKFSDAEELNLAEWAQATWGIPFAIDNDARVAAIGEWRYGAGQGCNDMCMITLGTGIGTAVIIDGKVLRGKHGQGGNLGGHLIINYNGLKCGCPSFGCAEAEAGTWQLPNLAKRDLDYKESGLSRCDIIDYEAVFLHATKGDKLATRLRDHAIKIWSVLCINLIHAFDPERIVMGGGIMASANVILPRVQAFTDQHALTPWGRVTVHAAERGDQAALLGCEWLVKKRIP